MANLQAFERTNTSRSRPTCIARSSIALTLKSLAAPTATPPVKKFSSSSATPLTAKPFLSALPNASACRARFSTKYSASAPRALLKDPTISDILVNRFDRVYVERAGKLEITGLSFKDNQHLMQIIDRIVSRIGRRVDDLAHGQRPLAGRLPRQRHHSAARARWRLSFHPPFRPRSRHLAHHDGEQNPFRAHARTPLGHGQGPPQSPDLRRHRRRQNHALNVLSGYIPNSERIVTIEDAAELQLKQEHVVRLETRPPNIEGKGAVRMRQLVINSLRMRPDRIVVGEVRGEEAFDMLQAMNTGHEGSLTTVHANSPRDALNRVENMVSMANLNIPERAIRHQVANAIHAVVQIARLSDGTRKVITVSEVTGMEGDPITLQDIFIFDRIGIDESGNVRGPSAPGVRPHFAERLATAGCRLIPPVLIPVEV